MGIHGNCKYSEQVMDIANHAREVPIIICLDIGSTVI